MSKYEKDLGILKPSEAKRIDPKPTTGHKHRKKVYPPHWQIRPMAFIWPSKNLSESTDWHHEPILYGKLTCYQQSQEFKYIKELFMAGKLDDALAIYAKYHPETANWPVRFIGIQPIETLREVLS